MAQNHVIKRKLVRVVELQPFQGVKSQFSGEVFVPPTDLDRQTSTAHERGIGGLGKVYADQEAETFLPIRPNFTDAMVHRGCVEHVLISPILATRGHTPYPK